MKLRKVRKPIQIGLCSLRKVFFTFSIILFFVGCVESPAPDVKSISKIQRPLFSGSTNTIISSSTLDYSLLGTCDPNAYLTEYSFDKNTWTEIACNSGFFTLQLNLKDGTKEVYARSKGKFNYTGIAQATIRFLLPPSSSLISAVTSSQSDDSDSLRSGTQSFISNTFEQKNINDGTSRNLTTGVPRITYEN